LVFSTLGPFSARDAAHGSGTTTISGAISYIDTSTALAPVANKSIYIGSSTTSASQTVTSDGSGNYSATLPDGINYTLRSEWYPSSTAPLPGWIQLNVDGITLSGNTALNVTLPAANKITMHVTDGAGNPLPGATISLGSGGSYVTSETATVTAYTGSYTSQIMFGGRSATYAANDAGIAEMWVFDYFENMTAYVTYTAPSGYTLHQNVLFSTTSSATNEVVFVLPALVTITGNISYTESTTALAAVSLRQIRFSTNEISVIKYATTDASGNYSVVLPVSTNYSMDFSWNPITKHPQSCISRAICRS
jgi:hypothetical protein